MIKTITGQGHIMAYQSGSMPYINNGMQSAGTVRFNTSMQQMEVYDGITWLPIQSSVDIALTPDAGSAIEWARKKMAEEKRLDELCEKYPGLARARDNFETFLRLVEEENSVS